MFGLIGGAISAGLGVVSSIKNNKKQQQLAAQQQQLAEQQEQNRRDYLEYVRNANEANEGEDAVTEMNRRRTADAIRQRNAAAAGTAAVVGGTTEAQMAAIDKNNDLIDQTNQANATYVAQKHQQNLNRTMQAESQAFADRQQGNKQQQANILQQQQQLATANQQANTALSSGLHGMLEDAEAMYNKKHGK